MKTRISRLLVFILIGIFTLAICSCSNSNNTLQEFVDSINFDSEVSSDLPLQSTYVYSGKSIDVTWYSSNESALSITGVVTRKQVSQSIILIMEATLGDKTLKKSFNLTITADTTLDILNAVASSLMLPLSVDSDLSLTKEKKYSGQTITIEWISSNSDVMDGDGKVTLQEKETKITMKAILTLNGQQVEKEFMVTVAKDPSVTPDKVWHLADVWEGEVPDERKPGTLSEFAGAIYRKCVSSRDYWLGIEVLVTLPEVSFDEKRQGENPYSTSCMRYLDNPSVYLGGNANSESDVGLSWMVGATASGNSVDYTESVAFRPFWRYIDSGKNNFANAAWKDTWTYYYPGDTVLMSVYSPEPNYMQLRIELISETTIPKYVAKRASYNLGSDYPKVFVSPLFPSKGMGVYRAEFKRVCALDQVNNEGKPAQKTNAKSENIIWNSVYLYRMINGEMYKVPMTSDRYASCNAPSAFTGAITVSYDGVDKSKGGEIVTINPHNN